MNFNRNNFNNPNPQIWDTRNNVNSNIINPNPPFFNNYYGNQTQGNSNLMNYSMNNNHINNIGINNNIGNNNNNNIPTDYQQHYNPRPLLSLHLTKKEKQFRKFTSHQFRKKNTKQKWNDFNRDKSRSSENVKDSFDNFSNFNTGSNDSFETHHNSTEVSNPVKPKSLVETLKAVQSSSFNKNESPLENLSNEKEINAICAKNATDVTKKLFSQLKTMNKSNIRDLINNPKLKHETALKAHAREKLRQEMRKQLKILSAESDSDIPELEPDMCVDSDKIPDSMIDEIERTLEMSLFDFRDDERNILENNATTEDKDIEVVKQNLGNDFFLGSEMLLMNGFSLLDSIPSEGLKKTSISDEEDKKSEIQQPISTVPVIKLNLTPPAPTPPPKIEPNVVDIENNSQTIASIGTTWSASEPITSIGTTWSTAETITSIGTTWSASETITSIGTSWSTAETIKDNTRTVISDDDWNDDLDSSVTSDKLVIDESKVDSFFNEPKLSIIQPVIESNVGASPSPKNDFFLRQPDSRSSDCPPERIVPKKVEPSQTYGNYKRGNHIRFDQQNAGEIMEVKKSPMDNNNKFNKNDNNRLNKNNRKFGDKRRKSRFDTARPIQNSYDRNKYHINNLETESRYDRSWDKPPPITPETIENGPSYRFKENGSSQDPDLQQLTSILQPKTFQFKGSFLKPSRNNSNNHKRPSSNSREPARNKSSNYSRSSSRDRVDNYDRFSHSKSPSIVKEVTPVQEDIRPCFNMLKKMQEIDSEITKVHEKLHGIDKVIMNLQTEKVGIQKTFSRLQNERKVLFDSIMKKATAANNVTVENRTEVRVPPVKAVESTNKAQMNRKLQDIVDKKRKIDHTVGKQDEVKKRKVVDVEKTCTKTSGVVVGKASVVTVEKEAVVPVEKEPAVVVEKESVVVVEKALQIVDNKDPKVNIAERKKSGKKVQNIHKHQQHEEVDGKLKATKVNSTTCSEGVKLLENKVNHEEVSATDKCKKIGSKSTSHKQSPQLLKKRKVTPRKLFHKNDIIEVDNYKIKNFKVMLSKLPLDLRFNVDIDLDVMYGVKVDPVVEVISTSASFDETVLFDDQFDFLQKEEALNNVEAISERPPTPGSDVVFADKKEEVDYLEWTGNFDSHTKPITHLMSVQNQFLICASEDGKIYKYSITDGTLLGLFTKHTDICNSFIFDGSHICSVSSDGFVHRIDLDTFECIASAHFDEPLQILEKSSGIFIGAKSGKIFKLKLDLTNGGNESPLCDLGSQIFCIRADKEGPRKILLVSSRKHSIQIRDQNDGLLLRTFCDALGYVNVFDILVVQSEVFCGSSRNEILSADFITGALKKSLITIGAGIISLKLIRNFLIAACSDGNIYVFDIKTIGSTAITSISGPGNMLLSMDLWENKIIASTKDGRVKIISFQM